MSDASTVTRTEHAWHVLHNVLDPEVPALSVCDLGIVREVRDAGERLEIVLTPTSSGCPATEAIEHDIRSALERAGLGPVHVSLRRAPAWTTDWISEDGKRKLAEYGIAPPGRVQEEGTAPIRIIGRRRDASPPCPRCGSTHTERLSAFGSTACKALYRCLACREPFEHFKPI